MPVAKSTEPKGIKEKILAIQRTIQVEKSGEHPKYGAFIRDEDVVNAVRSELNKYGIIVGTRNRVAEHHANTDDNGRYIPNVFLQVDYVFTDVETGEEFVFQSIGEGKSVGDDVSSRKSFTMARKIAFLQLFQIGEVNDKYDADSEKAAVPDLEPAPPKKSEAEKAEAQTAAASLKDLNVKVKAFIDGPLDGKIVATEGQVISDRILGEGKKQVEWKKDVRVVQALVQRLEEIVKTGEVS